MPALCFFAVFFLALLTSCGGGGSSTGATGSAEVDSIKPVTASGAQPSTASDKQSAGSSNPSKAADNAADAPIKPPRTTVTPDADPDPDPNEFIQVEFEAVPQNEARIRAAIQYPPALKAKGIAGTVYVKVLIDKDGYYKSHLVRDSPDPALADAVVAAIKDLYCTPARKDGKPIKVWINFEHSFR